jgi:glycerol-3-phosphate acyltransferase PlsY
MISIQAMEIIIFVILSYLYGSIPFAYSATYLLKHKRLTEEGTGNIGVTNAYKVGGTGAVIITLAGEISKALLPIYAARAVFEGSLLLSLLFAYCALLGTSFSIFLKGRGGKGSTVALWSILILSPYSGFILLGTSIILSICARNYISIKKLQLLCIPVVIQLIEHSLVFTAFAVLTSLLFLFNNYIRKDDFAYYHVFQQKPGLKDADSVYSQSHRG